MISLVHIAPMAQSFGRMWPLGRSAPLAFIVTKKQGPAIFYGYIRRYHTIVFYELMKLQRKAAIVNTQITISILQWLVA